MWVRKNYFLLIKVRADGRRTIPVPLPLSLAHELLRGAGILLSLLPWSWVSRWITKEILSPKGEGSRKIGLGTFDLSKMKPGEVMFSLSRLIEEARRVGPCTLLEVRDGDDQVTIRLV